MNEHINRATSQYVDMLREVLTTGIIVKNARTGVDVRQCADIPKVFSIWLYHNFQLLQNRQYYLHVAAAETAWQLTGTQNAQFINEMAPKLWSKFTDEHGNILNAQGYRWRAGFGRDQIQIAIDRIRNHPTDRQIIVSSWHPGLDGLGNSQLNTHCLPFMQFQVIPEHKYLNLTVFSRSSDMILGFPYDIYNYSFLLYAISSSVDLRPGYLNIVLNNYHIYLIQDHIDVAVSAISGKNMTKEVLFKYPTYSFNDIISFPTQYIYWVKSNTKYKHSYAPTVEVVV